MDILYYTISNRVKPRTPFTVNIIIVVQAVFLLSCGPLCESGNVSPTLRFSLTFLSGAVAWILLFPKTEDQEHIGMISAK